MAGRQAKTLSTTVIKRALAAAGRTSQPHRDRVIVLLSLRAGLRACEIAGLEWPMVLGDDGRLGKVVEVRNVIAKGGHGRQVPLHPELRTALAALKKHTGGTGPVIRSSRGGRMRANSVVNWFVELYASIGADGCSSHSGRRTFITHAARKAHKAGASIRDVQMLAGHCSIETTQRYIDGDTDAQRRLVSAL